MEKGKITISIVIFFISIMLVSSIFIQFRTVEETNMMGIESMREDELRQEVLSWKSKYNEIDEKLKSNNLKIQEYTNIIENNQQASELIDTELKDYNMLVGKTNVVGEGIVIKLIDNSERSFTASNIVYLINELKYAGAEAISINGERIINSTDVVGINNNQYILVNGERIVNPYEIRAIGNKDEFDKILNFPNDGFIPYYTNKGYSIEVKFESNININAYNKNITLKYMKDKKEE
ncbi:MAG: DUF881 domain-containing protein [Clostridia bacterium]|nr:DUF881 domain-containing protein [Clostridia bacterium]